MVEIEAGGFYTNSTGLYVREIIDIFGPDVTYQEYVLSDDALFCYFRRKCVRGTFKRWATRPCTPEEIVRITDEGTRETSSRPSEQTTAGGVGRIEIRVGGVYTNRLERFAREVTAMKGRKVTCRDFDLSTGRSLTSSAECDIKSFRDWATRPCTTREVARLSRDVLEESPALFGELVDHLVKVTLETIPDDQLLGEVRRRGLL